MTSLVSRGHILVCHYFGCVTCADHFNSGPQCFCWWVIVSPKKDCYLSYGDSWLVSELSIMLVIMSVHWSFSWPAGSDQSWDPADLIVLARNTWKTADWFGKEWGQLEVVVEGKENCYQNLLGAFGMVRELTALWRNRGACESTA